MGDRQHRRLLLPGHAAHGASSLGEVLELGHHLDGLGGVGEGSGVRRILLAIFLEVELATNIR